MDRRIATLLAALLAAAAAAAGAPVQPGDGRQAAVAVPATLQAEVVLRLGWGGSEREVGLRETPDGRFGPQALSVEEDRNRLHVLDSVNERILTFGIDGALVDSVRVPALAEDIALLPGGGFAVLIPATRSLACVTFAGASCGRAVLPRDASLARGLRKLAGGAPALWRPDNTMIPLTGRRRGGEEPASLFATAVPADPVPETSPITLRRAPDGTATLETPAVAGEGRRRSVVSRRCGNVESLTPVGRTAAGDVYLAVEESCRGSIVRFLEVFPAGGPVAAAAELPSRNFAFVYRDLDLDRGGRVYQLVVLPEGVIVLRWSLQKAPPRTGYAVPGLSPPSLAPPALPGGPEDEPEPHATGLELPPAGSIAALDVSQQEVMSRAQAYAIHTYTVGPGNLTPSGGAYCGSKLVKTPAWLSAGATMMGVPYKWGGFTSLEYASQSSEDPDCAGTNTHFFDAGLAAAQYAGDTCASTCSGMYCGAHCAVGVDCSGYVSRAWGLPGHVTTSALAASPYTCPTALRSLDSLLAGDVLNRAGSHMRLFAARSPSGSVEVLESSGRDWKVAAHSYQIGELEAYRPYRKRAIGGMFAAGERVVSIDEGVDARPCTDLGSTTCNPVGQVGRGQPGIITAGPDERGGYLWWWVDWESAPDGWTAQCFLGKSAGDEALDASLVAAPAAGSAPLSTTLSAGVTGTVTGPTSYTFWWDCPDATTSVADATVVCGSVATASWGMCSAPTEVGYQCNGIWENPKSVAHTYAGAGLYTPKVIVERRALAAESRTSVSVQAPCSTTVSAAGRSFAWGARSGSFDVGTQAWCSWTASSGDAWIHVTTASGTGSGTVHFSLDANTSTIPRTGTITVQEQTFSVNQSALRPLRTRLSAAVPPIAALLFPSRRHGA